MIDNDFSKLQFNNNAPERLRQIYAVLYFMGQGFSHTEAIKKSVGHFPKVNDYQTIQDKCGRQFAGTMGQFTRWFISGNILEKLTQLNNLDDNDRKIFSDLLGLPATQEILLNESSIKEEGENYDEKIIDESGAGYGTAEENQIVEQAAIIFVTRWYVERGWAVKSVETDKRGFDLICSESESKIEENVEVKGIRGHKCSFIITAGEIKQACENEKHIICILTNALSEEPKLYRLSGKDFLENFSIKPIQFKAELK